MKKNSKKVQKNREIERMYYSIYYITITTGRDSFLKIIMKLPISAIDEKLKFDLFIVILMGYVD